MPRYVRSRFNTGRDTGQSWAAYGHAAAALLGSLPGDSLTSWFVTASDPKLRASWL